MLELPIKRLADILRNKDVNDQIVHMLKPTTASSKW